MNASPAPVVSRTCARREAGARSDAPGGVNMRLAGAVLDDDFADAELRQARQRRLGIGVAPQRGLVVEARQRDVGRLQHRLHRGFQLRPVGPQPGPHVGVERDDGALRARFAERAQQVGASAFADHRQRDAGDMHQRGAADGGAQGLQIVGEPPRRRVFAPIAEAALGAGEADHIEAERALGVALHMRAAEAARLQERDELIGEGVASHPRRVADLGGVAEQLRDMPAGVERVAREAATVEIVADRRELDHGFADPQYLAAAPRPPMRLLHARLRPSRFGARLAAMARRRRG